MVMTTSMHWTHPAEGSYAARQGGAEMLSNESLASEVLSHGAYVCLRRVTGAGPTPDVASLAVLTERLGLRNEFDPGDPPARESFALLRRQGATPFDIA